MIVNLGISLLVLNVCSGLQHGEVNYDYGVYEDLESGSFEKKWTPGIDVKGHTKIQDNKEDKTEESIDRKSLITEKPASSESDWPPKYEKLHKNKQETKDDRKVDRTPLIEKFHEPATKLETNESEKISTEPNWPPIFHKKTEVTKVIDTTPVIETHHQYNADTTKDGNNVVDEESGIDLTIDRTGIANYPFSASIQKKGSHYASGAVVGKQWIISAAQDFYNARETIKVFRVRLGSVDCKRGGKLFPLKRIEIHPSFVTGKPDNDVSLLQLARPVDFTETIRPIYFTKILVKDRLLSAKFLSTYWPRIIINGTVLPSEAKERKMHTRMRVSTQRLIKWDKCANIMTQLKEVLPKSSLCLRPVQSHHSSCLPDVGAPILANDGLWGVTSGWVSYNCSEHPSPTIATRVSTPAVRMWFNSIVYDEDADNRNSFEA